MKIQRIVLVAVVIAIAGIVQAKTIKEIEKDLKEKKNEWTKMQKENPGCVLEDNSKQQQAIVKRAGVKGHRNYFGSKQTLYVRDSYYCTFCKRDYAFHIEPMGPIGDRVVEKVQMRIMCGWLSEKMLP